MNRARRSRIGLGGLDPEGADASTSIFSEAPRTVMDRGLMDEGERGFGRSSLGVACVVSPGSFRAVLDWLAACLVCRHVCGGRNERKAMDTDISHPSRGTLAFLKTAMVLAIIGAINWGLIGFFNWNLVDAIFGGGAREMTSGLSRIIYAIVGLAGLASLYLLPQLNAAERRHHAVPSAPPSVR